MRDEITGYEDIITMREAMDRLQQLRDELTELREEEKEQRANPAREESDFEEERYHDALRALRDFEIETQEERAALELLEHHVPEGKYLVADRYFEEYARDLAQEMQLMPLSNPPWPFTCIDWQRAASELKHDFTPIYVCGEPYWYRE